VDHGYGLYGAVSKGFPLIHEDQEVALKLIRERYINVGSLHISPASELVLRLPINKIGQYFCLAEKHLLGRETLWKY
jgi:hypothetical protein